MTNAWAAASAGTTHHRALYALVCPSVMPVRPVRQGLEKAAAKARAAAKALAAAAPVKSSFAIIAAVN